ncbi:M20/M25/M40 family metallo-hydrolase [Bacillus sp. FSL W7-1321]
MQQTYEALKNDPAIQQGLAFIEEDDEQTLAEQVAMTEIPAPPFKEAERAAYVQQKFSEYGLEAVRRDKEGNVIGAYKGVGDGPVIVLSAHLDTVFPEGTDTKVRRERDRLCAPGIFDDTRGLAEMLSIIRALHRTNVKTSGTIQFVASVGEEGIGDLRGVKAFFADSPNVDAFISIDGTGVGHIVYEGTGSCRYKITYSATGGHSYGDFGLPSAIHAAGRAVAAIADCRPPTEPKTTFTIGEIAGGTAVNAIASSASFHLDVRSTSPQALEQLESTFLKACKQAAEQENRHWQKHDVTVDIKRVGDRPAGRQDKEATIVQAVVQASKELGIAPALKGAASTDSNIPIHLGIPAVTVGRGGNGGGTHTLGEWFEPVHAYLSPQRTFLAALALVGVDQVSRPLLA